MERALFRLGASGHQQLGNDETAEFVAQQFRALLLKYREHAEQAGKGIVAYAALAIGADQLFVKTALELGVPAEAIIPCAHYEAIFSTEAHAEYVRLLNGCQQVHRLPAQDCSGDAYLAAGQWIVDQTDLVILAWNGYPAAGRGGTADVASYARYIGRPFVHIHTRLHTVKHYAASSPHMVPRRDAALTKKTVYQGAVLTVNQYRFRLPSGDEIERDIVERPESVLVLPVGQGQTVLLIDEYDVGAGAWQLTLPGGKAADLTPEGLQRQAQRELREELGYRAGRLEKLLDFYGHPGYMAHNVHLFVVHDLEWDPLEMERGEEIQVQTMTLDEALAATRIDYRCDPEAALALWLYAGSRSAGA